MSKRSFLYYDECDSPVGTITMVATEAGLCRVDYGNMKDLETKLHAWAKKHFLCVEFFKDANRFTEVKQQLLQYFNNERNEFAVTTDFYGTVFQQKVWKALMQIPYGETRSYKDIALNIQAPRAVRAVGGAVNQNPMSIIYPCHRVIGSNGALVGYAGGLDKKKHLLSHEQVKVG
ncbi:iron-sulfur binding protein [Pontibacillus halophilus JSM 076056 = DSM 19796]|uniref:Methylated-DNA--protein-cysteine methyltransferase n=1 Tax=Pontibacillus halophilus JSM 076056 = DSM 19796 TaxID=1385510 RepID=A0A0A5GBW4_9BACI|nr:methylated-DNA--[protein]-cysteine S-methyltransferase [Pontibacillus halophilus]KGX90676.1 iron-sulfur binding protein [Pontibacillus halophilus JSM 076056 = DSM 19796]